MGTWRCPHCATLQVEALRCFVCNRSATSCGTCLNFRRSLVGGTGYCALDRRREPLNGAEQRDCWTDTPAAGLDGLFDTLPTPLTLGAPAPPRQPAAKAAARTDLPATAGAPKPPVPPASAAARPPGVARGLIELVPHAGLARREGPPVSGT